MTQFLHHTLDSAPHFLGVWVPTVHDFHRQRVCGEQEHHIITFLGLEFGDFISDSPGKCLAGWKEWNVNCMLTQTLQATRNGGKIVCLFVCDVMDVWKYRHFSDPRVAHNNSIKAGSQYDTRQTFGYNESEYLD